MTQIGHYRIGSEIGRGGMGVVYRAVDTKLGRPVAIKVLPSDAMADRVRHFSSPYESQRRFFDLLGTATEHKKHVALEGGHVPNDLRGLFRETLDWLDKYLGPVK